MKRRMIVTCCLLVVFTFQLNFVQEADTCNNFVPDEKTALKIAEAVWLPIYGDSIYEKKPFVAKLSDDEIWQVSGTLRTTKGGVPYIEIQKCDCKVLKVEHGK